MCLIIGLFILIASTCAILMGEKKTSVVEKPKAKDDSGEIRHEELKSLESLEEKVLDANLNISAKLDDISELAAKGNDTEAVKMLVEMKEQQKIQQELIVRQEQIVAQLNKKSEILANATAEGEAASEAAKIPEKLAPPENVETMEKEGKAAAESEKKAVNTET
ncbi:Aa_trans domain-containing protein [Caenorhabditis elegans]|nr:Aa_trans domain-containing protein [Caenorhabditis elegans]CDO50124.1 Aa_trans domain-containing protein [Caenorhabditis elegans]|eukprot:NP_001293396.1 Uncharacterized protein CELE_Y51F10.4 [Caenorhabditis elegans]